MTFYAQLARQPRTILRAIVRVPIRTQWDQLRRRAAQRILADRAVRARREDS